MRVLLIDNYDSFTYNLVHLLEELNFEVVVKFNDEFELDEVNEFHKILLSPGPGLPQDAGLINEIIEKYAPTKSILGICLGMQAIGEVFGGTLKNLNQVYHGMTSQIKLTVNDEYLYKGINSEIRVGRYHSWIVDSPLPDCLEITSLDEFGNIMSLRHKIFDVRGVQFHPESYMTLIGSKLIINWLNES
ncbi:anthranilate synthase component II [Moheibacter sediminis]|uniref:Anthranilate synthase component 2 n=1 Tax=Moheibacter sediminis TaxID=1434700 RepID=A0A1W1Z0G4_9FLAO|nr:aminodeoxychorismate/anthranilate synthase component II [Moheibacter sediminis]SMC41884.1 anthranilate synthase component 2 [Moheibacter sediminis]